MLDTKDILMILHPAIAVAFVFPIIGIVCNFAWQTRQRRLTLARKEKSKIPPVVGKEHVQIGKWLTGAVVASALLPLMIVLWLEKNNIFTAATWQEKGGLIAFQMVLAALTIASLVFLFQATEKLWRGTFATLAGMGLVILGCQEGIFRRENEWFVSHFFYGTAVALLMIFSVAVLPEIYRDRSQKWRKAHALLNAFATILFIGQGITGARDLLEIPLSWQKPFVYGQCNYETKVCAAAESRLKAPFLAQSSTTGSMTDQQ
ncbi:MAG: DUF4079 domain-containing protein [Cyanobacteria bacterium P01_C01_bin.89]